MSTLIGQGSFGCVYYQGITCDGKINLNKKFASKLQVKDESALNEINIGKIIMTLPNYHLFFLPIISSCAVNISTIDKKIWQQCNPIKKYIKEAKQYTPNNFILSDITYVGENKTFLTILNDTAYISTKQHLIIALLDNYVYLLEAITLLLKAHLVHFDIQSGNIIYDNRSNLPLLLDFGLSIHMDTLNEYNIKEFFYTYSPDYYVWCLDIHVINYLLHETTAPLTEQDINSIVTDFVNYNKGLAIFSAEFKQNYKTTCINYLRTYVGQEVKKTIDTFITFYPYWDNYSLSVLYLKMFSTIFSKGFHDNSLIVFFSQVLLHAIHPDPQKRYTVEKTNELFKEIFYVDDNVDNYVDFITTIDYDLDLINQRIKGELQTKKMTRAKKLR